LRSWEALLETQPVSKVCSEAGIAVSQFYRWQKMLFEQGAGDEAKDKKLTALEEKLQRKHEVLSELLEEHVR
jgi:transposase-like protein